MSQRPLISILSASLNRGSRIGRMLDSVHAQELKGLEHWVIDGGSRDETIDVLRKYKKNAVLDWVSEPDTGIADALNKALHRARGTYIYVLQSDDYLISSDIFKRLEPLLAGEQYDICSFPVQMADPKSYGLKLLKPIPFRFWNRFKFIFLHQGCFVHRRVFDRIGVFNTAYRIAMDYDFFYRALNAGCTVFWGKRPVAVMAGDGLGSHRRYLEDRLREERLVQKNNENNVMWRAIQRVFHALYLPFKLGRGGGWKKTAGRRSQ